LLIQEIKKTTYMVGRWVGAVATDKRYSLCWKRKNCIYVCG